MQAQPGPTVMPQPPGPPRLPQVWLHANGCHTCRAGHRPVVVVVVDTDGVVVEQVLAQAEVSGSQDKPSGQ